MLSITHKYCYHSEQQYVSNTNNYQLWVYTMCRFLFVLKEYIANLTTKLNKACFAIRAIKPYMSMRVLRSVYFSSFHSVMSYAIIFWGSSSLSYNIFKLQKRAIRIIANKCNRDSCRQLFNQYQILTLHAQYIFSLVIFVIKHSEFFPPNSEIHDLNTRNKQNLHFPATGAERSFILRNQNF